MFFAAPDPARLHSFAKEEKLKPDRDGAKMTGNEMAEVIPQLETVEQIGKAHGKRFITDHLPNEVFMKKDSIWLALGALMAAFGTLTAGATGFYTGANLLQNGGFNAQGFPYPSDFSLILAPWQWSGSIGYTWANNSESILPGPGATVDAGGYVGFGDGLIYQDVETIPGQTYELTIIAHRRGTTDGTWLQPLWDGNPLAPGLVRYWEWTVIRYEIHAADNNTRLTIMPTPNNGGPTWIDGVHLAVIPEPGAVALLAVSSSLLCLFRRRRVPG